MESQEYLDQISAKPVVEKNGGGLGGILKSKYTWIIVGGIVLFILFAIIGTILSSTKGDVKGDAINLQVRLDSTAEVISEYQPKVKSSALRSSSASLSTVIANTNNKLTSYLSEKYEYKKGSDKKLVEQMKTEQDGLMNELYEAKITGVLDRTYAHKMAFEISKILAEEAMLRKESRDDNLNSIIDESYGSLENLYEDFNNFSEGS
ncbi:hypothetical protein IKF30_01455 [Candidatus Saccharibacteria bacterium]|nr:hypothetical protein [Candidatus Saccharibacteria bacterium]